MLLVPSLPRQSIDSWKLDSSGLPIRVVNSARSAGLSTVGDLRQWSEPELLALRSLGRISINHIQFFFRLCSQIELGAQRFQTIQEILSVFLDEDERHVLASRYGFLSDGLVPSRSTATLQDIGNEQNRTRERIRQVEEAAKLKLRSELARLCLEPFYEYCTFFIRRQGEAVSPAELAPMRMDVELSGYNPCGLLLLLHDLRPGNLRFYNGFFSTLPSATLERVQSVAVNHLREAAVPQALEQIVQATAASLKKARLQAPQRVIAVTLQHTDDVGTSNDGRHFAVKEGLGSFLAEILETMDRPAHYRTITRAYNERVLPSSRLGSGRILQCLNRRRRHFQRIDRGLYALT